LGKSPRPQFCAGRLGLCTELIHRLPQLQLDVPGRDAEREHESEPYGDVLDAGNSHRVAHRTDNGGLASSAATRTITVADFTLSDSPSSQSVTAGGSAAYTVSVTPGAGFSGNVALSVTGCLRNVQSRVDRHLRFIDDDGLDERVDAGRQLHPHDHR